MACTTLHRLGQAALIVAAFSLGACSGLRIEDAEPDAYSADLCKGCEGTPGVFSGDDGVITIVGENADIDLGLAASSGEPAPSDIEERLLAAERRALAAERRALQAERHANEALRRTETASSPGVDTGVRIRTSLGPQPLSWEHLRTQ